MPPSGYIFYLILLLIFILISAFFSIAESVFSSASEDRFHKLKADGITSADKIINVLKNRHQFLNTSLFWNVMINSMLSTYTSFVCINIFKYSPNYIPLIATILGIVIFIFGEALPKILGIKKANAIISFIVPIFLLLRLFSLPIIILIDKIFFFFFEGKNKKNEANDLILGSVEMYHQQGDIEKDEKTMLSAILNLDKVEARSVMTEKSDIYGFNINLTNDKIYDFITKSAHSKIPVFDERYEKALGVILVSKFLKYFIKINQNIEKIQIEEIMEKPYFIPESSSIKNQLQFFKKDGGNLLFVVDEYGVIAGILTLEDIIERIVGDISDENDIDDSIIEENEKFMLLNGHALISSINIKIGSRFSEDKFNTISGLIVDHLDRMPKENEELFLEKYKIIIKKVSENKIDRLVLYKNEVSQGDN